MTERRCETCRWWAEIVQSRGLCFHNPYRSSATRPVDACDQWAEDGARGQVTKSRAWARRKWNARVPSRPTGRVKAKAT